MPKPSDTLFQLIKRMTPSEKRYFRQHYDRGKTQHSLLYDFLNTQEVYDEAAVKEHFKKTKLGRNLKVYKRQLLHRLMKSLNSSWQTSDIYTKVSKAIFELRILESKGLYTEAESRIARLKRLCDEHDLLSLKLQIIDLQVKLIGVQKKQNIAQGYGLSGKLTTLFEEFRGTMDEFQVNVRRRELTFELKVLSGYRDQQAKDRISEILVEPCFQPESIQRLNEQNQIRCFGVLATAELSMGKLEEAKVQFERCLGLLRREDKIDPVRDLQSYVAVAINYALACNLTGEYHKVEEILSPLFSLIRNKPELKSYRSSLLIQQMAAYLGLNLFEAIEQMGTMLHKHYLDSKQHNETTFSLLSLHCFCHLISENYEASKALAKIYRKQNQETHYIKDFSIDCCLCIAGFESGDWESASAIASNRLSTISDKGSQAYILLDGISAAILALENGRTYNWAGLAKQLGDVPNLYAPIRFEVWVISKSRGESFMRSWIAASSTKR